MILCDTGPLVAAFNKADTDHARCVEFLTKNWSRLVIPATPGSVGNLLLHCTGDERSRL
jgi:hypothetical protein